MGNEFVGDGKLQRLAGIAIRPIGRFVYVVEMLLNRHVKWPRGRDYSREIIQEKEAPTNASSRPFVC